MSAQAIIRVFCVDGPFPGVQYLDADSGAVMFIDQSDIAECFYKIEVGHPARTDAGMFPTARFVRLVRPDGTQAFD